MLVLASASPSRQLLLAGLGVPFEIDPPCLDEQIQAREKPIPYVQRMSKEKAICVAGRHQSKYVLAADTIVALGTRILRKAQDAEEAHQQLRLLSGKRHRVYTSLTVVLPDQTMRHRLSMTHVAFKVLEPQEIEAFVASDQWKNVAVYRHEGMAACFTRSMRGLPSTIAGLPLWDTYQLLRGLGLLSFTDWMVCSRVAS